MSSANRSQSTFLPLKSGWVHDPNILLHGEPTPLGILGVLPLEIRQIIYRYITYPAITVLTPGLEPDPEQDSRAVDSGIDSSAEEQEVSKPYNFRDLARVSKQFQSDFHSVHPRYSGRLEFVLKCGIYESGADSLCELLPPAARSRVKEIVIQENVCVSDSLDGTEFPELEAVVIEITSTEDDIFGDHGGPWDINFSGKGHQMEEIMERVAQGINTPVVESPVVNLPDHVSIAVRAFRVNAEVEKGILLRGEYEMRLDEAEYEWKERQDALREERLEELRTAREARRVQKEEGKKRKTETADKGEVTDDEPEEEEEEESGENEDEEKAEEEPDFRHSEECQGIEDWYEAEADVLASGEEFVTL